MLSGILLLKCSVCVSAKKGLVAFYKASRSFSLLLCSLDTFVELDKPEKIIFCKNLYNNVIKSL